MRMRMRMRMRLRCMLPSLWAGVLVCIAAIAAPSVFAALTSADAGRVVSRIFLLEAWLSLALALLLLWLDHAPHGHDRSGRALLWGTLGCTLLGYFAVQPLMAAARAGQGVVGFGALHLISTVFYALKTLLVLWLAWRSVNPVGEFSRPPFS